MPRHRFISYNCFDCNFELHCCQSWTYDKKRKNVRDSVLLYVLQSKNAPVSISEHIEKIKKTFRKLKFFENCERTLPCFFLVSRKTPNAFSVIRAETFIHKRFICYERYENRLQLLIKTSTGRGSVEKSSQNPAHGSDLRGFWTRKSSFSLFLLLIGL